MIRTPGLTHISLAVQDADRSSRFYRAILGAVETFRENGFIQIETPDTHDVIVFVEETQNAGKTGGIQHFGFRLVDPADIGVAVQAVEKAGGKVLSQGEFCPGEPYVFFADPDGYEVEIWYEPGPGA